MLAFIRIGCFTLGMLIASPIYAAEPAKLPVREVTIFKDGHAFVVREGNLPVNSIGEAVMQDLPTPVLGTFWSYTLDKGVQLRSVTATRVAATTTRDATNILEILSSNLNATVTVRESDRAPYTATVLGLRGNELVLLRTDTGLKLVRVASISDITLHGESPKLSVSEESQQPQLTLGLDGTFPNTSTRLGVMYLQNGLRWIPSYKIVLDEKAGKAHVSLQATLVNELTDLERVTAHLVIGVPKWDFAQEVDPISIQETLVQLSGQFAGARTSQLSNAIMTQGGGFGGGYASQERDSPATESPRVMGSESRENFHIFSVNNISLKRGDRMVIPITTFTLNYTNVYKLELAPAPPREWQQAYYSGSANRLPSELTSLLASPKVRHYIRISNTSIAPLTTAPALLLSGERVLSQGTMSYTPKNGEVDIPIGTASNITVKRTDVETGRVPNVKQWNGYSFEQVDLDGTVCLTNYGAKQATIEVSRYVLGTVIKTSEGGTSETLDLFSGSEIIPSWWGSYNLPNDLGRFNGLGRAKWDATVLPGKSVELAYSWRYLWR